ncbi:hypothetical protein GJ496_009779 [Pomphorhynchus laevis]|nr:hypothetical protein GJ496_009779 [Pomphorhynchus laevis]
MSPNDDFNTNKGSLNSALCITDIANADFPLINDYLIPRLLYSCCTCTISVTNLNSIDAYWRIYEVAAAIIRLYGELCQNIPDFIDPSVESESKAAKKSVNSQYDEVLSCSAKFHNRLRQQWSKCLTQAHVAATVNDGLAELSVSIQRIPNDNDSLSGISSHHSMAYCYECEYCSTILSDNVKIVQGHYNVCARMVSAGYTIPRGEKRNANNRSLKSILDDKDSSPQLTSIASIECVNKSYLNIGPKYLLDVDKVVSTMNLSNPSSQYGDDNLSYPEFTNLDRCPEMYDNLSFLSAMSAFDTLDHDALFVALSNAGCPNFLLDYIRCSYDMCDTSSSRLSSSSQGYEDDNISIGHTAYVDDILLFANDKHKMQFALDELSNKLRCYGLRFRPQKCFSIMSTFAGRSAFNTLSHIALLQRLLETNCPSYLIRYNVNSYEDGNFGKVFKIGLSGLSPRLYHGKLYFTKSLMSMTNVQNSNYSFQPGHFLYELTRPNTESVIYDLCNDLEPNISFNVQNETTLCLPDHLICNQQSMICSPSSNTDEQCVSSDNTSQPVKTSSSRSPDPEQVQVASNELCRLLSNKDIDSPDLHECGDLLNNVSDALNAGCTRLSLTTLCFNQQHLSSAQPDKIYDINRNRLGQYNIAAIAKHLYMDGRRAHKSKSLLETLGLHAVQIQSSANDIKRSIFNSIYKNPTRTKEVRRKMIGEIKSDKAKWSQFLSINDETTIDYCRLLSDLKQKRSIHGLSLLQIAAEAYQSIFERTNSIKKEIRAVFDGNLSRKDNYVWSLSVIWRQASTQALGIDLMTNKHGPPSSMFSYSYSSKPHHIFVNLWSMSSSIIQMRHNRDGNVGFGAAIQFLDRGLSASTDGFSCALMSNACNLIGDLFSVNLPSAAFSIVLWSDDMLLAATKVGKWYPSSGYTTTVLNAISQHCVVANWNNPECFVIERDGINERRKQIKKLLQTFISQSSTFAAHVLDGQVGFDDLDNFFRQLPTLTTPYVADKVFHTFCELYLDTNLYAMKEEWSTYGYIDTQHLSINVSLPTFDFTEIFEIYKCILHGTYKIKLKNLPSGRANYRMINGFYPFDSKGDKSHTKLDIATVLCACGNGSFDMEKINVIFKYLAYGTYNLIVLGVLVASQIDESFSTMLIKLFQTYECCLDNGSIILCFKDLSDRIRRLFSSLFGMIRNPASGTLLVLAYVLIATKIDFCLE